MPRIIITASGGGHTGYAVALAQALLGKAEMLFIVPDKDEWSRSKVVEYGEVRSIRKARGPRDPLVKALPGLTIAFLESLRVVPRSYDCFISTGSNHSVPPALAGKLKGLKMVNLESSVRLTRPSLSYRFLKLFADLNVLQWDEQKMFSREKSVVVGPIYEKPLYDSRDEDYILITGGTYGHRELFEAADKLGYEKIVLQTGRINPEPYRRKHPSWIVFDFDPDFQKWIAGAHVVVSHLGKTVIDAALTYRKPVVIVPNPEWRYTAGWRDAEILADKLNAVLVKNITSEELQGAIEEAGKRRPPLYPNGADKLADIIVNELLSTR